MQLTTLALSLAPLLLTVSASPVASPLPAGFEPITGDEIRARLAAPESALTKRQPGGIYLCTGANYSGTCGYAVQPVCSSSSPCNTRDQIDQHCVVLTSPYYHNIGSFGPDQGATVYVSSNGNCHESDGSISYPGTGDFKNYQAGPNAHEGQIISSFLVVAK